MARLIDERPEDNQETEVTENEIKQQEPVEDTSVVLQEEDEIPDKYKGKSTAEIVRMHQKQKNYWADKAQK